RHSCGACVRVTLSRNCACWLPSFEWFSVYDDPVPSQPSTLSLHDALPISGRVLLHGGGDAFDGRSTASVRSEVKPIHRARPFARSEEHTSELQSRENLVCRLLLEKKKWH